ncbi:MAG: type III pantothenate kinase [Bacteroidales bacterium]|nr:type III pantothenate kinase [Bacteroidales bacterium]
MNLNIDIGNTRNKIAIINNGNIIDRIVLDEISPNTIHKVVQDYPEIKNVILSSVKQLNPELLRFFKSKFDNFIELTSDTKIPIENLYQTKETLGKDRLAAVVGANNNFPTSNVLVIDMGTAITFDFINSKAQYLGGTISPGMEMRFKALNYYTGKLPLINQKDDFNLIGKNTEEAIISGVQSGITFETDSYINYFKQKYDDLKTILTGGDAIFFDKKLKNTIFVNLNLNFIGLNTILEYNLRK